MRLKLSLLALILTGLFGVYALAAPRTGVAHYRSAIIAADGSATVTIPEFDPAMGTLVSVIVKGECEFELPSWYVGPGTEGGAAFGVEDLSALPPNPAYCWWGWNCSGSPPTEGDPGGPWEKVRFKTGSTSHVAPRIETGIVYVEDTFGGGQTTEVHGADEHDTDSVTYTANLDRWEGTGDITWTIQGSYGGNTTCSGSGTSAIGGWDAFAALTVTYNYAP